ncbi:MAG: haloacid dehalogenase-like hydrolase [Planctomycetes bacterium]|nr:haloacid dehalogenase-like hydrolase [Planctomycetota bacterium]
MKKIAFVYDFDGTLAEGNIQEHSLLGALGYDPEAFWDQVEELAKQQDADEILVYLQQMIEAARAAGTPLTRAMLAAHGSGIKLFPGVQEWFQRINQYAREYCGLEPEHFIISSGNLEMIEGTSIAAEFTRIFACKYLFDDNGHACWPGVGVNYTTKTQFLFRINKGIHNCHDSKRLNKWLDQDQRPVPFERMIFFGDGDTDIPAMKLVKTQGGYSIAVFDNKLWNETTCQEKIHKLISEDRVSYVAPGNYESASLLDVTVKGLLKRMGRMTVPGIR